jgi:hypothetical protein
MKTTRTSSDSATTLIRQSQCFAAMAFSEHCFSNPGSERFFGFLELFLFLPWGLLFAVLDSLQSTTEKKQKLVLLRKGTKNEAGVLQETVLFYIFFLFFFFASLSFFLCRGSG